MIVDGLDSNKYQIKQGTDLSHVLDAIEKGDGHLTYTGEALEARFIVNGKPFVVDIESGYQWDGASIPGIAQWFIGKPLDEPYRVPSMLHDGGYEDRTKRVLHDVIFYSQLRLNRVPKWKALMMFAAVRFGGHVYYAAETSRFWRGVKWTLERI